MVTLVKSSLAFCFLWLFLCISMCFDSISLRKPPSLSWDESPALTGLSWSSCSGGCSSQNIHGIQLKRMACGCVFCCLTKIWQEKRASRVVCLHVALQGAGSNTVVGEKLVEGSFSWSCLGMGQSINVAVVDLAGPERQEDSPSMSDKTLSFFSFILYKF